MNSIIAKPLAVDIGGKRRQLHFNLNTFAAFEEKTGKFFLSFASTMERAVAASKEADNPMLLLEHISARDVLALVWAACHEYDANDEPRWPLSLPQMGRLLDIAAIGKIVPMLLTGTADNAPDAGEIGARPPDPVAAPAASRPAGGGDGSGPSDEDVLASVTLRSDA